MLTTVLSMLRYVGESEDRDLIDRLHSYFTTNILIALSVLVSFKQFGGKPMECLVPDLFTGSWEQVCHLFNFRCHSKSNQTLSQRSTLQCRPRNLPHSRKR
ncbi:hypothetical protein L596_028098 [Steinernema carpocapsae]|uniref:Innexin n=1 Tax=Steinernema carpocapsae TaxID=34508 RepID=A0A4U5LXH6_STECR|nr:hypothetical protein L596_028098 [Steinernema carpocapsae]